MIGTHGVYGRNCTTSRDSEGHRSHRDRAGRQSVLYTPLREALRAAAATLDGLASGPPISHSQTTELPLAQKHVSRFRRWLNDAALRARVAGDVEKAEAFDRIRDL
jgi:hypothetical protein